MSKQWLFNIVSLTLIVVLLFFWAYSYARLKGEVKALEADNKFLTDQMKVKDEASKIRQEEYQKLEDNYKELNQQLEDIKDEDSKNWLSGSIPTNVDNTIPY